MKRFLLAAAISALTLSAQAETLRFPHELGFGGAESLDPISPSRFFETNQTVYNRLVRQSEDGKGTLEPSLATEWKSSPDAKVWTFKLRESVKFHNGNDFDAKDAIFSLMRIKSEKIDSPARGGLKIIEEVKALDDHTIEVTLNNAHADFPILLMDYRIRMLDAETCNNDMDKLCESGIGTGPFKVVDLDAVGTTKLTRFDDYWEGPAKVENVEIIGISDQQGRVSAMQSGQIDMLFSVTTQQKPLFASDKFTVQTVPTGRWVGLAMRTDTKPFDNAKVRKAIRMVADREAMGKLVMGEGGFVVTCDHPVWSGDQYRVDIDCKKDIEGAKKLLAEAGYKDGIDITLFVSDISEGAMRIAEVYQAQVKEAGINVKLEIAPADGYWSDTWMKEAFSATAWSQRPADQILNEAYRGGSKWNETYWNNKNFDTKLDAARKELDADKRKALYGEVQKQLWEEGGSFIPFHQNTTRVISSKLSGIPDVEDFTIRFQHISKQ